MAALTLSLTGCFDDDSTLGVENIKETTIEGIEDSYVRTAYVGERLTITPTVTSSFDDSQMTYTWLLLDKNTGTEDNDGNVVEPTVIGNEKTLDYEVALAPGTYEVRFVATSSDNGYSVYYLTTLTVRTLYSQGFYILKQTADGNTDLDLLTLSQEQSDNLIANVDGQPLSGKPISLYPNYFMNYINPDNDKIESTNAITVTTDRKCIDVRRVSDFKNIFTRDNICYDAMDEDEQFYATCLSTLFGYTLMYTSKGIYQTASSKQSNKSTGQFGMPKSKCGGSNYFFIDLPNSGNGALWDANSHSLKSYNYNINVSPLLYGDLTGETETQQLTDYDCIHCGFNRLADKSTGLFILSEGNNGKRHLYISEGSSKGVKLSKHIVFPDDSHAARATAYSTNGISASYLYCIDSNKLYAYIFNSDENSEAELKLEGIPSDETLTYVTNQFWNPSFSPGSKFDYLVVATQKGDFYKLYFYNTNGGAPEGSPIMVKEGVGKVKCVRFLNDGYSTTDPRFGRQVYNIND